MNTDNLEQLKLYSAWRRGLFKAPPWWIAWCEALAMGRPVAEEFRRPPTDEERRDIKVIRDWALIQGWISDPEHKVPPALKRNRV